MLSPKGIVLLILLSIATVLAVGNLWYALVRSTIPLSMESRLVRKELRHEKHPGRDDVCFLHLESGDVLHVDAAVYEAVDVGELLRKQSWSTSLQHDEQVLSLVLSPDFRGLLIVMPIVLVICAISCVFCVTHSGSESGAAEQPSALS